GVRGLASLDPAFTAASRMNSIWPGRASRTLPSRLLVAPADVDHPIAIRRLRRAGAGTLLGLADLLGGQLVSRSGLPPRLLARARGLWYRIRKLAFARLSHWIILHIEGADEVDNRTSGSVKPLSR